LATPASGQLSGGVDLLEEPPDNGSAWLSEAQELIIIPVLVSATNGEPESFVLYGTA